MILESIVTTVDPQGRVNIAPMGPIVRASNDGSSPPEFCLRPYDGSQTCQNLLASGKAVVHVTDDALLIAKAALGEVCPDGLVCQAENASDSHWRLIRCHRWFAIEVTQQGGVAPRYELNARCVADGIVDPFFGFNRAKHAVIEAAILATRVHLIPHDEIVADLARLSIAVEKTAGEDERQAFELICEYVEEQRKMNPIGEANPA